MIPIFQGHFRVLLIELQILLEQPQVKSKVIYTLFMKEDK